MESDYHFTASFTHKTNAVADEIEILDAEWITALKLHLSLLARLEAP